MWPGNLRACAAQALLGALLVTLTPAQAQTSSFHGGFTGQDLLGFCKETDNEQVRDFGRGICAGYIDGFAAGHHMAETWHAFHHRDEKLDQIYGRLCIPAKTTLGQISRMFVNYLERHPQKLALSAGLLLEDAMREAFPCPK
jgi:hypothetical protein